MNTQRLVVTTYDRTNDSKINHSWKHPCPGVFSVFHPKEPYLIRYDDEDHDTISCPSCN